jgi:4-amino-4-deoxy-L-arabinose transferase-like glycosyltransferase
VRTWALPAVLLLCVTLPHLGQGDFRGDAGWYSAIGLQAWRTGSLWTLFAEPGEHYFNKPPVAFWVYGLALWALGPSVWAARLPSILAALLCTLLTVAIVRRFCGLRTAMIAGAILALTVEFFRRTREVSLDLWQLVFLLAALWCIAAAVARGRPRLVWLAGLPLGLALLTKPLVGLVFIPVVALWLVLSRERRHLLPLAGAGLVAVAVAAPWHISMHLLHPGEFAARYFGAEIAERAKGHLQAGHKRPPPVWYYLAAIGGRYWPWLAFVLLSGLAWARGRGAWRDARGARLALVWTLAWLAALTIYADRRDRYAIVLYPALAWLAALWLSHAGGAAARVRRAVLRGIGPVAVVGAAALALAPVRLQAPPDPHWQELFAAMRGPLSQEDGSAPDLYEGGTGGAQEARLYLEFGRWPIQTQDASGRIIARPAAGSLILYHHRGGLAPGPGEKEVFRSGNGNLILTRLETEPWSPLAREDPGE